MMMLRVKKMPCFWRGIKFLTLKLSAVLGAAVLVVLSVVSARSAPINSMLGIDVNSEAEKPTAADYVQDGLVAMWDGIENVGWGTHDPSATTWVDLSGTGFIPRFRGANIVWGTNYLGNTDGLSNQFYVDGLGLNTMLSNKNFTIDMVFECVSGNFIFSANNETARGFWVWLWNRTTPAYTYWQGNNSNFQKGQTDLVNQFTCTGSGIYINGQLVKMITSGSAYTVGRDRLMIGSYQSPGGDFHKTTSHSNMNIYRMAIYERSLTDEEIAHNYEIDRLRFGLK